MDVRRAFDRQRQKGKAQNNSRHRATRRKAFLKKAYGLTEQAYENMYSAQNGKCAVCGRSEEHRRLSVDHDHSTGKVRSLLCSRCNSALGLLSESVETIQSLKEYVLAHKEK